MPVRAAASRRPRYRAPRSRSRAVHAVVLLAACLGTTSAPDDQDVPLFSAEIRLPDYGIEDPASIRAGEVTVTWKEEGAEFRVGPLRDRPRATLPVASESRAPAEGPRGCSLLDGAGLAGINALGGRYGAYGLGGATASTEVGFDPVGRSAMIFECLRSGGPSANCGLWMQLFDPTTPVRAYLDASGGATLSIWVNRRPADAPFTLRVADAAWSRRDDSTPVGPLDGFLVEDGAGEGWQRVTVPLEALPGRIARDSLATLVFEAAAPGRSELLLGGVELCGAGGRPGTLSPPPPSAPARGPNRALWVWNTRQLIDGARARSQFLDWVEEHGFDRIFLQIVPAPGRSPERGFVPFDGPGMGALIAQLRDSGTLVYAMDGDPHYADPENHEGVLSTIRAIVDHNRRSPPEQRFHGVHYDIEPYLIPGFQGPGRKGILDGFVQVVSGISRIAHEADLEVGIAVPFWLDGADAYTGELMMAEHAGRTAPVLEHLVDLVDELAVMDYRTTALGTNGAMALVLDELAAARRAGIGVWVGVETVALPDADAVGFTGTPRRGLPEGNAGRWIVVEPLPGNQARFWYVADGGLNTLRERLASDGADTAGVLSWPAGPTVHIPGDMQSYHRLGSRRMETEVSRLLTELANHPAFLGMAYHHYETLRDLGSQ